MRIAHWQWFDAGKYARLLTNQAPPRGAFQLDVTDDTDVKALMIYGQVRRTPGGGEAAPDWRTASSEEWYVEQELTDLGFRLEVGNIYVGPLNDITWAGVVVPSEAPACDERNVLTPQGEMQMELHVQALDLLAWQAWRKARNIPGEAKPRARRAAAVV